MAISGDVCFWEYSRHHSLTELATWSYATLLPDLRRNKFRYRGRWHKIFGYVGALLGHLAVSGSSADLSDFCADNAEEAFLGGIEHARRLPAQKRQAKPRFLAK
jgi:hypothetical protein